MMRGLKKETQIVPIILIVISIVITFGVYNPLAKGVSKDENEKEWLGTIEEQLEAKIKEAWKKVENGDLPNHVKNDLEKWEGYLRDIKNGNVEVKRIERKADDEVEVNLYIPAKKTHLRFVIDSKNNKLLEWKSSKEVEATVTVIYENPPSDGKNTDVKLKPIKLDK